MIGSKNCERGFECSKKEIDKIVSSIFAVFFDIDPSFKVF